MLLPLDPSCSKARLVRLPRWLGIAVAVSLAVGAGAAPADEAFTTSVYSQVDKSYKRKKDASGKWEREYYAMANAGMLPGTARDHTMDKVPFVSLAGTLAEHLARQGYFPATEGITPSLLVVIHWGTTVPFNDGTYRSGIAHLSSPMNALSEMNRGNAFRPDVPTVAEGQPAPSAGISLTGSAEDMARQAAMDEVAGQMITQDMFNRARDQANERNARLLGYLADINQSSGIQRFAGGGQRYDDLIADIEESRYYVIISAYDFQKTVKEKKQKLLWVTRVSIRTPGNNFGDRMATMVANASRYFGQESGRLVRQFERTGTVQIGEATVVGTVPDESVNKDEARKAGEKAAK